MERVFVTGAGGYIGTTLVPMLLEAGYSVRAADRYFFGEHRLQDHPALERLREDSRLLLADHLEGIEQMRILTATCSRGAHDLI